MWQIILYIFLAILFVGMFLVGLILLKLKADETEEDVHPSSDRASRASRWDNTRNMTPEERRGAAQSGVFNVVTSPTRSATVSDIQQIINASNINRPAQPDPSYNGESASIALSRDPHATSPSAPPVTTPQNNKPQEPEESKEKYHSSNAIDDLDLT